MTMGEQVSDVINGDGPQGVGVRIAGNESEAFDGMVSAVGVQPAALVVTGMPDQTCSLFLDTPVREDGPGPR